MQVPSTTVSESHIIWQLLAERGLCNLETMDQFGEHTGLISPSPEMELAVSVDTLVCDVHFPRDTVPEDVGYKSLAVNLSDLAAMGAEPLSAVLSLTRPEDDQRWLEKFIDGLSDPALRYGMRFQAATVNHGPLSVTIQVYGYTPPGTALRRASARPNDAIYVTGTLGDAGLALARRKGLLEIPSADVAYLEERLSRPTPRIEAGMALRNIASAAIDISDGFAADLRHVLAASHVGAVIHLDRLPLSRHFRDNVQAPDAWDLALSSGDDYELCFTVPPERSQRLEAQPSLSESGLTWVGTIEEGGGLRCVRNDGEMYEPRSGYEHFA